MIKFPNGKINLGLHITEKRVDGYHNLDTVFYPIPLYDVLEFNESESLQFTSHGIAIPGDVNDNIILKAYHLLKKDFPQIPALNIHLLKNIPTGAGLGGGSADASFMLMMLNKTYQLQISKNDLLNYALKLGSDCPFFIINTPCQAQSRGEVLNPISLNLSAYRILLVKPNIHVSTAWAFSQLTPKIPIKSAATIVQQPIETWQQELMNDFEAPLFAHHPELKMIKQKLIDSGASYASMSGSGSTIFGLFTEKMEVSNQFASCELFWI